MNSKKRLRAKVKPVTVGAGDQTIYLRIPKRLPKLFQKLREIAGYEFTLEPDPDDPENPLGYKIVYKPRKAE